MNATICLIRHAIAEERSDDKPDEDRRLTAEGRRKMTRAARGLKRMGVTFDVILSSPLPRAMETAGIVARLIAPGLAVEALPALAPGRPPQEVLEQLRRHRKALRVALVGHEPSMGELASYLLTGSTNLLTLRFKKGAAAAIGVTEIPPASAGALLWFIGPGQLRKLAPKRRRA